MFAVKLYSRKIFSYVFFVRKYFHNEIKANYGIYEKMPSHDYHHVHVHMYDRLTNQIKNKLRCYVKSCTVSLVLVDGEMANGCKAALHVHVYMYLYSEQLW